MNYPQFCEEVGCREQLHSGGTLCEEHLLMFLNTRLLFSSFEIPETCHLSDLLLLNNIKADDGADSDYGEPGAPPTEGGDVEGQYESSEVGDDVATFGHLQDDGPALLLAASVPLPDEEGDFDLGEVEAVADETTEDVTEAAVNGNVARSMSNMGSTFQLPGINWTWPSEASVAVLVQRKVPTRELLRILPPAQRSTKLQNGRIKCNARARINEDTREWEVADCSKTFGAQYEYRRHLRTIHLGGDRWEQTQAAEQRSKKRQIKREPKAAPALASTSTSASVSELVAVPPQPLPKVLQKRTREVVEMEKCDDSDHPGYSEWNQEGSDRKGKKVRR